MLVPFKNLGQIGIIDDIPPHELPLNAWSAGQNIRFKDNRVEKFLGHSSVFTSTGNAFNATGATLDTTDTTPLWMLPVPTATTYWWIYCGTTSIWVTDGTTHYDISRASGGAYTTDGAVGWNGGVIGGIPVINNSIDNPQEWATTSAGTKLTALTYDGTNDWATLGHKAKVIRPFKQYLVALDFTKAGTRYPRMVKWSAATAAGATPTSWDETVTTNDANETELADTPGFCIDMLPLGDTNIIYKEDSIWGMQFVGGNSIFRFFKISGEAGLFTRRCMKAFERKHIVLTPGDLIVHDGQQIMPILDQKRRRWLFNNIDPTYYTRCFIVPNYRENEMWVCFPSTGAVYADKALVWNWRTGVTGVRDLPTSPHIAYGLINPGGSDVWDNDTQVWDLDTSVWNVRNYNPTLQKLLISEHLQSDFYVADDTDQFNGTNMTSYIERTGLVFDDIERIKRVNAIYPNITGSGSINIYVGQQMRRNDAVSWEGPYSFTINSDRKIDCSVTGRYIGVKFETTGNSSWKLADYDMDISPMGYR